MFKKCDKFNYYHKEEDKWEGLLFLEKIKKFFDRFIVNQSVRTLYYLLILILLVLIYGFHDMSAGPFIYAEF
ncbi:teichoic acid D-Ala incorporation-associated protein DltX [Heyndrickxia vini]|uniref:Teichoic acid D-Ala incorporation-associated protein DltX n=2 Tax=Heyndrickxia vini TaxID=1476025 RepID=A0ABX7DZY6_9BACI|nr:teichoic acid D-Ala incorporation-associated protein DltX [Heyndrickxia vini]